MFKTSPPSIPISETRLQATNSISSGSNPIQKEFHFLGAIATKHSNIGNVGNDVHAPLLLLTKKPIHDNQDNTETAAPSISLNDKVTRGRDLNDTFDSTRFGKRHKDALLTNNQDGCLFHHNV